MKHTILSLKSLAITAAGCALLGISATAFAVPINPQPFTVEQGAIPGTSNLQFTADRFGGTYNEIFTAIDATNFAAKTVFSFGSYALGFGNSISSALNSGEPNGYQLYALLDSSGTYSTSGTVTSFTAGSNDISIYADLLSDTSASVPGTASGSYSITGGSEDILLASSSMGSGVGSVDGSSQAPGNFGILFSGFTLTAAGQNYFIAPVPFYVDLEANGNFNPFSPAPGSNTTLQGVANGYFVAVPGPGSFGLALLGMALLGLGFITKRSQSGKSR